MYINFKEFKKSGLTPEDLVLLCAIKQENVEHISANEDKLPPLKELIKEIKGKPKQSYIEKLRLSDKGKDLLESLESVEVSEETEVIFDWLSKHYKKLDKKIGNEPKTKRHIESFSQKSGIKKNNLIKLCTAFIRDETNMEYSHILEYVFYKPKTAFETRFNLHESRLYKYYKDNENYFSNIFEE